MGTKNSDSDTIAAIVRSVMLNLQNSGNDAALQPDQAAAAGSEPVKVRTGISNRHIHLDRHDMEILFGQGHELAVHSPLSQEGMFAAEEKVILVGPKGCLTSVRVLGPLRKNTQIELAGTDARILGINPPVLQSGQISSTPELTIVGPLGSVTNHNAVMIAKRHVHMDTEQARKWGFRDGDIVKVRNTGPRAVTFEEVVVRTGDGWVNEFHIDTDEGNAAGMKTGDMVEVFK